MVGRISWHQGAGLSSHFKERQPVSRDCTKGRCLSEKPDTRGEESLHIDGKTNLLNMFSNTSTLIKPSEVRVVVKRLRCGEHGTATGDQERACEHGCAALISKVVKNALERDDEVCRH